MIEMVSSVVVYVKEREEKEKSDLGGGVLE
jgi:hypothetical protein